MKKRSGILLLLTISVALSGTLHAQSQQAMPPIAIGATAPNGSTAPGANTSNFSAIASPSIFDGSTNVRIPIHSFSLDNQDYGISLGYNTRGVTVDEYSTPIGTHWNFENGSITRIIKDLPDEVNKETVAMLEYFPAGGGLSVEYTNHKRFLKGKMVTYTETAAQQALNADVTYRDQESDDFIFSCGGRSFTFNLAADGQVFTHPHNNIKVTPLIDGVPVFLVPGQPVGNWGAGDNSDILEFLVRDEQGTKYHFVRGDFERQKLYNDEYGSDEIGEVSATTRWVIKEVTFANGNVIRYNYSAPFYGTSVKYYKQYYARENWSGGTPTSAEYLGDQIADGFGQRFCRLTGIEYPNGTQANFIYSNTDKNELGQPMLREVTISSAGQCMRYKLSQSQVNDRWFLNSVRIAGCDSSVSEPYYSFEYNPIALPPRFNAAQDYYGYYNGDSTGVAINASGNKITIPKHHNTSGALGYGNERYSNPNYAVAGNLMKVKNAFGGEVSFRYSGNDGYSQFPMSTVSLPNSAQQFMGDDAPDGLRVDSIIETDKYHPGDARITVYEYGGGQLFMPGGYFHYPEEIDSASNQWKKVIFQNMFLTPHQFVGGANHGYSTVTEKNYTGTGQLLGRTVTTFSNMSDEYNNWKLNYKAVGKHYFQYPYTDKQYLQDWKIGLPMKVVSYDQNNRIVKQVENFYDTLSDYSAAGYLVNTKTVKVNSGSSTPIGLGSSGFQGRIYPNKKVFTDSYSPYTGASLLRCSKVRTYVSDTRYVEDSTLYAYDSRNNLKSVTTLNSMGEKIKTVAVYNYDVDGPGVQGAGIAGTTLYSMTDAGLEKPISTERWKQAPGGSVYDQKLVSAFVNTFSYEGGVLRAKAVYNLKIAEPLAYSTYTGMSMGSPVVNPYSKVKAVFSNQATPYLEKTTEVKLSDTKGNPLETQLNNMELYKSMIWDTVNGKKLAEVAGAPYTDIAFSGFESSNKGNLAYDENEIVNAATTPGGAISGTRILHATSSTAPLKRSGLTAGKEYVISFWCYGGTPLVGGAGLGSINLALADSRSGWSLFTARFTPQNSSDFGFLASGSAFHYYLDDVRIYPASATMQTYNYTPLFGMVSSADANGRITYYEYDPLGRQTIVRDQQGNIVSKTKTYNGGAQ